MQTIKITKATKKRLKRMKNEVETINFEKYTYDTVINFLLAGFEYHMICRNHPLLNNHEQS
jgi:hypothetical protein